METVSKRIAEFLKEFAASKNVSFTFFQKKTGVSSATMSTWRSGRASVTQVMRDRLVAVYPELDSILVVTPGGHVTLDFHTGASKDKKKPRKKPDPELGPTQEELQEIFAAADEMVGVGDPDYFDEKRAMIRRIQRQLWRAMGWAE